MLRGHAAQVTYTLCNLASTSLLSRPLAIHFGDFPGGCSLPTDAAAGTWRMRGQA